MTQVGGRRSTRVAEPTSVLAGGERLLGASRAPDGEGCSSLHLPSLEDKITQIASWSQTEKGILEANCTLSSQERNPCPDWVSDRGRCAACNLTLKHPKFCVRLDSDISSEVCHTLHITDYYLLETRYSPEGCYFKIVKRKESRNYVSGVFGSISNTTVTYAETIYDSTNLDFDTCEYKMDGETCNSCRRCRSFIDHEVNCSNVVAGAVSHCGSGYNWWVHDFPSYRDYLLPSLSFSFEKLMPISTSTPTASPSSTESSDKSAPYLLLLALPVLLVVVVCIRRRRQLTQTQSDDQASHSDQIWQTSVRHPLPSAPVDSLSQMPASARQPQPSAPVDSLSQMPTQMSPEDYRKLYVSNLMKTQKYDNKKRNQDKSDSPAQSLTEVGSNEDSQWSSSLEQSVELSECVCAICLDPLNENETVSLANHKDCPHMFHRHCVHEWLMKNDDCPVCRRPYLVFKE